MNYRLSALVASTVVSLLAGCRPDAGQPWLNPKLAAFVDAQRDGLKTPNDVWRGAGIRLSLKDFDLEESAEDFARRNKLVMVSFPEGSRLGEGLKNDPQTLFFAEGKDGLPGLAAVALTNPEDRGPLAMIAHEVNGKVCGNLIPLSLATLSEDPRITPPVYVETVALPGVDALISEPKTENIDKTIKKMEQMGTRYHESAEGLSATAAIETMFRDAAADKIPGLTIEQVSHVDTKQKSLVVTIPGTEDNESTVILGAHLDSINRNNHAGAAPGADDDASGIATLVETLRAIAAQGSHFRRKIELHGYAAEEVGLIGSSEIAQSYDAAGRTVAAMFQIDMNSWSSAAGASTIYIVATDTSTTLSRATKNLLNTYLGGQYVEKTLAAGTSDHRSWTDVAYPAVFPFEDPNDYNESLHTPEDNSTTINNLPLSARFTKLALAFLAHEAGLESAKATYDAALDADKAAKSKDLKLAVSPTANEGFYSVGIAAAETIKSVELCVSGEAGSVSCSKELLGSTTAKGVAGRAVYVASRNLALEDGMRLVVYGYDDADKLVARRTVVLKKK